MVGPSIIKLIDGPILWPSIIFIIDGEPADYAYYALFIGKTTDISDILMDYSSRRSTSREKDNRAIERNV